MQVCYIMAITSIPGPGLVRAWKIALVPYVLDLDRHQRARAAPASVDLRIPVLVYSAVLIAMAVAALDLVLRVPQHPAGGWPGAPCCSSSRTRSSR